MTEIMLASSSDWKIFRLGQLFRERREKVSDKEFPPLSVTKRGIVPQLDTAAKTDDGDNRKLVRAGDFVINSRSDRKGSGGLSTLDGSVSLINIVLEPLRIHSRFAHHLLRSTAFQEEFYRWGHGIVADLWTTRFSDMKNIRLALPDWSTQHAIADFLDDKTTHIDQLITKKQQMLDLLRDREASVIAEAISGGDQALLTRVGHHVRITPGYAFASADFSTDPNDVPLLRGVNVGVGEIRWDEVVYWPRNRADEVSRFRLKTGDLVMGMDRPWISTGIRVAIVAEKEAGSLLLQRVCKIEPDPSLDRDFLLLLLKSKAFLAHFEPILTGVSVPHISGDQIAAFRFHYLPVLEQRKRARRAIKELHDCAALRMRLMLSIDLLRKLRGNLITSFVTGKKRLGTEHKNAKELAA